MSRNILAVILLVHFHRNDVTWRYFFLVYMFFLQGPWCNIHLWQVYSWKYLHVLFIQATVTHNNIDTSMQSRFELLSFINKQSIEKHHNMTPQELCSNWLYSAHENRISVQQHSTQNITVQHIVSCLSHLGVRVINEVWTEASLHHYDLNVSICSHSPILKISIWLCSKYRFLILLQNIIWHWFYYTNAPTFHACCQFFFINVKQTRSIFECVLDRYMYIFHRFEFWVLSHF